METVPPDQPHSPSPTPLTAQIVEPQRPATPSPKRRRHMGCLVVLILGLGCLMVLSFVVADHGSFGQGIAR